MVTQGFRLRCADAVSPLWRSDIGFPEIPLMEDVEMSRAMRTVGKLVRIDPKIRVITSSRRFQERGLLRQWLQNSLNIMRYLYLGATAEDIARVYRTSREADR